MKLSVLIITSLLLITINLQAQKTTITGNAKTYSGDKLHIYNYSERITNKKTEIASCIVDASGDFEFNFSQQKTSLYFISLGVFEGMFFAEPGDKLILALPIKTVMQKQDSLNPFFQPQQHYLRDLTNNKNNLTKQIKDFDNHYHKEMNYLFNDYKGRVNSLKVDSVIEKINKELPNTKSQFFKDYIYYRYVAMRQAAYERNNDSLIYKYFKSKPILYRNPAYTNSLQTATNSLISKQEMQSVFTDKSSASLWYKLNNMMMINPAYSEQELREYILIINLYRLAFEYKNKNSEFIEIFNQIQLVSNYTEHRNIAKNITAELKELRNGNTAPEFSLKNYAGEEKALSDYRGKFVYLNFFSEESYTGIKEIALLEGLVAEKLPNLQIISIYRGDNFEQFKKFSAKNNFSFEFLFAQSSNEIFNNYNLINYPSYFLIHPNGKIVIIAAPSPAQNFRMFYGPHYTEWYRQQIRNNSKNNGSLIDK